MLKIKLARFGRRNQPEYRIVVNEARDKRDGAYVALLGHYAPTQTPKLLKVDLEAYRLWMTKGAQPTDTVASLAKRFESGKPFPPKKKRLSEKAKTKAAKPKEDTTKPKAEATDLKEESTKLKTETADSTNETAKSNADAVETTRPTAETAATVDSAEPKEASEATTAVVENEAASKSEETPETA